MADSSDFAREAEVAAIGTTPGKRLKVGGDLGPEHIYLEREADPLLLDLCLSGEFVYILTSRQVGKSSLIKRTVGALLERNVSAAAFDLNTTIEHGISEERWYFSVLAEVCRQFGLDQADLERQFFGQPQLSCAVRFARWLEDCLLKEIHGPVVIFLDELDATLPLPFKDNFFAVIRSMYNGRPAQRDLARLSFVLVGATTPAMLIDDVARTPFNIGVGLTLADFTVEQAQGLMAAVGWPDGSQRLEVTKWIHDWTGGHPFLTAKMVAAVAAEPAGDWSEARTSALAQRLFLAPGMRTNETHLHYVAGMLLSGPPGVLPTYHAILNGRLRQRPPETVVSWLTLSGAVIVLDEIGTFAVRNRIYTRVFNDAWVARHQPPAPWRVEVASYARRHGPWLVPALVLIALLGAATTTLLFREREAAARLAVTHTIRTQRIQEFMVRLFDAGETDVSPAKDLKVLALLDSGVREAGSLSAEPQVQAALYHTLGLVYQRLGQYKQADDLLTRALQMRQAQGGPASPDAVESLVAIGLLRVEQADLDEGERTLQRALELSRRAEPVPGALTARATEGMGKVKEERGAYALAIPLYEEAVRLYATTDSPEERRVQGLSSLANAQFYAGNLDESEAINRRLLQEERQRRTGDHPDIADTLLNLGAIEFSRGRYPAAAERDREALGILERWYGPDHPEAASAMTILASALSIQKQFDEAAQLLERALRTQQRIYGAEHPRVAFALNEFGSVALQRKDFASAEAAFTQALAIYRKVYSDGRHPRIGTALSNLASVYSAQEQYARAEPLFREAIRLNSEVLSPTHQNTAIAQIKLGRVLSRQRRYAEAETYLLAGYETLRVEMTPSVSWLRTAREDLAALYRALGKPDLAIRYEKESDTAGRPRPGF